MSRPAVVNFEDACQCSPEIHLGAYCLYVPHLSHNGNLDELLQKREAVHV
jgi:hypothetical protein